MQSYISGIIKWSHSVRWLTVIPSTGILLYHSKFNFDIEQVENSKTAGKRTLNLFIYFYLFIYFATHKQHYKELIKRRKEEESKMDKFESHIF